MTPRRTRWSPSRWLPPTAWWASSRSRRTAPTAGSARRRYTPRTAGSLVGTPTLALARLNDNLRERGELALCTAVIVLLREGSNNATVVCAGHPLPFLVRDGKASQIGRIGPLLGAF